LQACHPNLQDDRAIRCQGATRLAYHRHVVQQDLHEIRARGRCTADTVHAGGLWANFARAQSVADDCEQQVDRALAQSLTKVQAFADAKKTIESNVNLDKEARRAALDNIRINKASIDDLSLDFTVPGYNIPLVVSRFSPCRPLGLTFPLSRTAPTRQ